MKQSDYFKFHEALCNEARALSKQKNDDYADPDNRQHDPFAIFANFMQCEHLNICTVEQGFLTRLGDKFSRLCNILKPGHKQGVMDESIRDTALDIINYVALLLGYLETKRREAKRQQIAVDLEFSETMKQGIDSTISELHKGVHRHADLKAGAVRRKLAELHEHRFMRDKEAGDLCEQEGRCRDWNWFRRQHPTEPFRIVRDLYTKWKQVKEEHGTRFVCPKCFSIYFGTSGVPGEPGCYGYCNGFSHGHAMPDGKPCNFSWDRDVEDKFVGLEEKS